MQNKARVVTKKLKLVSRQQFSKTINNLMHQSDMTNFRSLVQNLFPNEMNIDLDMFNVSMKHRFGCQGNNTKIIRPSIGE